jgi:probable F420-dependent oxidoreductase
MRIGVVYPQTEFGDDPAAIRDYAQTAESIGYTHILAYEHVLGANPERPGGWKGPYTFKHAFLEPFVLFSYIAAHTQKIELTTGILILPQRQTGLVAKQAATLDVLSGGRLRLGVGIGWNPIEYTALNQDFHTRGKRIEEQVELLRQLWTQPLLKYSGRWHNIPDAGINPLPIQRPIPIWFGGHAEAVLRRTARLGDGWMPNYRNPQDARASMKALDRYLTDNGRTRSDIGIEARFSYGSGSPSEWATMITGWQAEGATHLSFNTMGSGFEKASDHIRAIDKFAGFLTKEQYLT